MIINEIVTGVIAIIIAYLIGSISAAYIITRLMTGKDIRQLGSGNAGGNNVYRQVGLRAAIPVAIFDVGKGTLAVAIAHWLLDIPLHEPNIFVLLAGVSVIAGHMWPAYLKFTGGNGLSATIGALAILLPWELLIVIALILLIKLVTRNLVLSTNISLLSVPISAWFIEKEILYVGFSLIIMVILILNFVPQIKADLARTGNIQNLTNEFFRRKKP